MVPCSFLTLDLQITWYYDGLYLLRLQIYKLGCHFKFTHINEYYKNYYLVKFTAGLIPNQKIVQMITIKFISQSTNYEAFYCPSLSDIPIVHID